jgi:hypothetical protein
MLGGLVYLLAGFLGVLLAVIIVGFVSIFVFLIDRQIPNFFTVIWLTVRSFLNRKELSVFEDYVRKLNEFGVGKFELKRLGRTVTILLDGAPVALYKHYDDKIYFPIVEDYCWVSGKKPSDNEFMGAILAGCLASPLFAKLREQLREQKKERGEILLGGFYYFAPPKGEKQVIFQIFHLGNSSELNYSLVLPPVGIETDPESYLVYLVQSQAPYRYKIETSLPYKAVAQYGFPEEAKGLLYL